MIRAAPWCGGRAGDRGQAPNDPRDTNDKPIAELTRVVRRPQGVAPREVELPWPPTVQNTGDFFPAASQATGVLWNMAERAGAPDMYEIHVALLFTAWARAFESMEESFIETRR